MGRNHFFRVSVIIGFIIVSIAATSWSAGTTRAMQTGTAQSLNASQDALARDIENNLIAPCCWNQPVSEHVSEVSDLIRTDVRNMVAEGKNRKEIMDHYVTLYGERILAVPPARGINVMAYAAPFAALFLGIWGLFSFRGKRRSSHTPSPAVLSASPQDNNRYEEIIEKELSELGD